MSLQGLRQLRGKQDLGSRRRNLQGRSRLGTRWGHKLDAGGAFGKRALPGVGRDVRAGSGINYSVDRVVTLVYDSVYIDRWLFAEGYKRCFALARARSARPLGRLPRLRIGTGGVASRRSQRLGFDMGMGVRGSWFTVTASRPSFRGVESLHPDPPEAGKPSPPQGARGWTDRPAQNGNEPANGPDTESG